MSIIDPTQPRTVKFQQVPMLTNSPVGFTVQDMLGNVDLVIAGGIHPLMVLAAQVIDTTNTAGKPVDIATRAVDVAIAIRDEVLRRDREAMQAAQAGSTERGDP